MVRSDDYDFQLEGACLGHQEDGEVQVKVRNLNANEITSVLQMLLSTNESIKKGIAYYHPYS